jgi:adenylylsulfate kinase
MALLLYEEGVNVIIDATGHRRRFRDLARAMIPHFAEIHLRASLARCLERAAERRSGFAPRDVYGQAGREGSTVPGIDEAYEAPLHPELVLDTEQLTVAEAAERLVRLLKEFPDERRELSMGLDRRDRRSGEERR